MSSTDPDSANPPLATAGEKNSSSTKIVKLRKIPHIPTRSSANREEHEDFDFGLDGNGDEKIIKATTLGLNQIRTRSSSSPLTLTPANSLGKPANFDCTTKDVADSRPQLSSASQQPASTSAAQGGFFDLLCFSTIISVFCINDYHSVHGNFLISMIQYYLEVG